MMVAVSFCLQSSMRFVAGASEDPGLQARAQSPHQSPDVAAEPGWWDVTMCVVADPDVDTIV